MKEENKLIAEFIGFDFNRFKNDGIVEGYDLDARLFNATFSIDELKFNSDWNWLMEVVGKIKNIVSLMEIPYTNELISALITVNKKAVYNACLEFIKWYNEQNK